VDGKVRFTENSTVRTLQRYTRTGVDGVDTTQLTELDITMMRVDTIVDREESLVCLFVWSFHNFDNPSKLYYCYLHRPSK